MSGKMKIIPSTFKKKETKNPWRWPSCKHPKTPSFRASSIDVDDDLSATTLPDDRTSESLTTKYSSTRTSFSADELSDETARSLEVVISSVRMSGRLFFEPDETSSIVKRSRNGKLPSNHPFKGSVAMALESENPYLDFKKSMEEMVNSQGLLTGWDCLEELLVWYLKLNGKMNHGFIVGAFVDLLVGFANMDSSKKTMMVSGSESTYSSAYSSFSSPSSPLSPHTSVVVD